MEHGLENVLNESQNKCAYLPPNDLVKTTGLLELSKRYAYWQNSLGSNSSALYNCGHCGDSCHGDGSCDGDGGES